MYNYNSKAREFVIVQKLKQACVSDSKFWYYRSVINYINKNVGNPDEIVYDVCKLKYLYKYCDDKDLLDGVYFLAKYEYEVGYCNGMNIPKQGQKLLESVGKAYPRQGCFPWQEDYYARIIQRNCHNWIWKPICNDGTIGIHPRLTKEILSLE